MDQRIYPWRDKPSELINRRMALAQSSRLFLVQERGPTSFVVMAEDCPQKRFRVLIGSSQTCSCRDAAELCVHLLFVMVKVLRVPTDNPLVWQRSLLDSEVSQILAGAHLRRTAAAVPGRAQGRPIQPGPLVQQRPVADDDHCSICMDSLGDGQQLAFCSSGCGNSVHNDCMRVWASFRRSISEPVICPLCRSDNWGPISPSSGPVPVQAKAHPWVHCSACSSKRLIGPRVTCALCQDFNLCSICARTQTTRHLHKNALFVKHRPDREFQPLTAVNSSLGSVLASLLLRDSLQYKHQSQCILCNGENTLDISQGKYCELQCGHIVHHSCLSTAIDRDVELCCLIDGNPIFPGLRRRKKCPAAMNTTGAKTLLLHRHAKDNPGWNQKQIVKFGRRAINECATNGLSLAGRGLVPSQLSLTHARYNTR